MGLKKTYAGGKYTEAKMRSFITSALRRIEALPISD